MGRIIKDLFGKHEEKNIYRFNLFNNKGNSVSIINYGGIVTGWVVKDKNEIKRDIVAGFDNLKDYLADTVYMGCIVGRYANRIANGNFNMNGRSYKLACNNGKNHLHGGYKGFHKIVWDTEVNETVKPVLSLSCLSKDGEEGYPGNLNVRMNYSYTDDDELIIEYSAETDSATPVNLTSHCYFNLTGDLNKSVLDHLLMINAGHYTPVDENQIPTGEIRKVDKSVFDFNKRTAIIAHWNKEEEGFDHNFVLNKEENSFSFAALLIDPESGFQLSVFTTEPGMQLYTGNFLDGSITNKDGKPINKNAALCLETQHFPDSPNQLNFPSTILMPGEKYFSKTVYKIGI